VHLTGKGGDTNGLDSTEFEARIVMTSSVFFLYAFDVFCIVSLSIMPIIDLVYMTHAYQAFNYHSVSH